MDIVCHKISIKLITIFWTSQCTNSGFAQVLRFFEHFDSEILDKMTTVWSFGAYKCMFIILRRIVPQKHAVPTVTL